MSDVAEEQVKRLVLREWQIWHTYASFLADPLPPLESIAMNLVRFGVAESAMTSDGSAWWSNDRLEDHLDFAGRRQRPVGVGHIQIDLLQDGRRARVQFPPGIHGFGAQSLHDAAWLRWAELFLFGESPVPPRYVTAHLGACSFLARDPKLYGLVVYPFVKIYETGVVLVDFRMFSADEPTELDQFVDHYVNAPMTAFRSVLVPPGILAWSPLTLSKNGMFLPHRLLTTTIRQRQHQRAVAQRTRIERMGDFSFAQVSLGAAREDMETAALLEAIQPTILDAAQSAARARAVELGVPAAALDSEPPDLKRSATDGSEDTAKRLHTVEGLEEEMNAAGVEVARRMTQKLAMRAIQEGGAGTERFSTLALTIMSVVGFVGCSSATGPRHPLALGLFGPGRINEIGNHWTGRPHVYLIRFAHQAESAATNERRFGSSFGAIMGRKVFPKLETARQFLPASLRTLDDFAIYISSAISLCVHTRLAATPRDEDAIRDANRAELVLEHQVKVHVLEYGYALHRRIGERARDNRASPGALSVAERDLSDFEWALQDIGRFGEIRNLIDEGLNAFGVDRLRERMADAIRVRRDAAIYSNANVLGRWAAFLACVAGVLAVPPGIESVLKPLWNWLSLPRPGDNDEFQLLLVLVSGVLIITVLGIGYVSLRFRRPSV